MVEPFAASLGDEAQVVGVEMGDKKIRVCGYHAERPQALGHYGKALWAPHARIDNEVAGASLDDVRVDRFQRAARKRHLQPVDASRHFLRSARADFALRPALLHDLSPFASP